MVGVCLLPRSHLVDLVRLQLDSALLPHTHLAVWVGTLPVLHMAHQARAFLDHIGLIYATALPNTHSVFWLSLFLRLHLANLARCFLDHIGLIYARLHFRIPSVVRVCLLYRSHLVDLARQPVE